jgi:transposase InsO family protein
MELLKKLYYDPQTGYISTEKLYKKAKERSGEITRKMVKEFISKQKLHQLFGAKRNYYNSFVVREPFIQWQMDVGFFKDKPFLFLVDIFSKIGFARLLKNETAEEVVRVLQEAFSELGKPQTIYSDNGTNFESKITKAFLDKENVKIIFADGRHAAFVEVFIKTIKTIMQKAYKNVTTDLKKLVKAVVANYNDTEHSTIKMKPNDVKPENFEEVYDNILEKAKTIPKSQQLKPGDFVRLKIEKESFDKGYTMRYSKEIYEIESKKGQRYKLKDYDGYFYTNQLKHVQAPDEQEEEVEPEPIIRNKRKKDFAEKLTKEAQVKNLPEKRVRTKKIIFDPS